ncbi:MAG: molybdopterin-synthase adenylyltransferase MoeB [Pseudomonadota bacterium]
MPLTKEENERYGRHLILPEIGPEGQERLKNASVAIIGVGGLGSPASIYLAAAGIGRIGIVDYDVVDRSNLHRQVLYGTEDVGKPKLERAAARLRSINPNVTVDRYETRLTSENALKILKGYDVIVDGSDNYPTRYLVNDACVLLRKPNVYGSVFRFEGQISVFDARRGPCYRCLYREPPSAGLVSNCAEGGVLGVLPGLIGTIQATETIKLILGKGETLTGRLLLFDALEMRFREMTLSKDPDCSICSDRPSIRGLIDYDKFCGTRHEIPPKDPEITVQQLHARLHEGRRVVLLDVREPNEYQICRIEGARFLPLGEISRRLSELSMTDEIVTYCHHGVRSLTAQKQLVSAGFRNVRSLRGGIDAWSREIDSAVARY